MEIQKNNVLGVHVSVLNLDLAERAVMEALENKEKGYVCVTGVHGVSEAQKDGALREILNGAFLNTTDGMPLVWLNRSAGHREADRVYGPDLMARVCEKTAETGHRHFFFGGAEGVAQSLAEKMSEKYPGLRVAGSYTPPFRQLNDAEEVELRQMIEETRPDIFWVGLSTPKQEKFMAEYLPKLDVTLMFGVGAAFDFFTGRVKQAPRWVQRSGFEWFFRLCQEPKRLWKRYLTNNPRFIYWIFLQRTGLRKYE